MHYDHIEPFLESVTSIMEKIKEPLSEAQKQILAASIMMFIEAYEKEIIEQCVKNFALKEKKS
jgi:hypothetical protein